MSTTDAFLKALKGKKDKIFEIGSVSNKVAGLMHALAVQLLVKGIIEFTIDISKLFNVGSNKLMATHVHIIMGASKSNGFALPAILDLTL